jgi:hypothetical protein
MRILMEEECLSASGFREAPKLQPAIGGRSARTTASAS